MRPITYDNGTYTVKDIMAILNIGRNKAYELVSKNYFSHVRVGTAIRISKKSFDKWLNQE